MTPVISAGDLVERRVELITNALLHLPVRGAELQFAARQVELALRPEMAEAAARIQELETTRDAARANFLTMQGTAAQLLKRAERAEALVEQAFRDGLRYATLVEVEDEDLAWQQSRARSSLNQDGGKP